MTTAKLDQLLAAGEFQAMLSLIAVEVDRLHPADAAYYRGQAELNLGDVAAALASLAEAAAYPERGFLANHAAGRAHEMLDDPAAAARAFRAAARHLADQVNDQAFRQAALRALARTDGDAETRRDLAYELGRLLEAGGARQAPDPMAGAVAQMLTALSGRIEVLAQRQADLELLLAPPRPAPFLLTTDHPVALASDDHIHPHGTAADNTRSPRFVRACETHFGRPLAALDLGCSGGGLVRDFLLRGHRAAGLEGSDYSLKAQRAEWRIIPEHLHTCDILEPFALTEADGRPAQFDIVTAWEVLEHLPRERLPVFFANVRRHLAADGLFVASVALTEDGDAETGAVYHVTLEPPDWWDAQLRAQGLTPVAQPFAIGDLVRGVGNGPADPDFAANPDFGFHLAARRAD